MIEQINLDEEYSTNWHAALVSGLLLISCGRWVMCECCWNEVLVPLLTWTVGSKHSSCILLKTI